MAVTNPPADFYSPVVRGGNSSIVWIDNDNQELVRLTSGGAETVSNSFTNDVVRITASHDRIYRLDDQGLMHYASNTNITSWTAFATTWQTAVGDETVQSIDWVGDRLAISYIRSSTTGLHWSTMDASGAEEVTDGDGRMLISDILSGSSISNSVFGGGYVYFAVSSTAGAPVRIYSWQVGSADSPVVAAELPLDYSITNSSGASSGDRLFYYQGVLYIMADEGDFRQQSSGVYVAFAGIPDGSGGLGLQRLFEQDNSQTGLNRWAGYGNLILFPYSSPALQTQGLGAYDISTGGRAVLGGSGVEFGAMTSLAGRLHTIPYTGGGTIDRANTSPPQGCYVISSVFDLGSNLIKQFDEIRLVHEDVTLNTQFFVSVSTDKGATWQAVTLTATDGGSVGDLSGIGAAVGIQYRIIWSATSFVDVYSVEVRMHHLDVVDEVIQVPVDCRDNISYATGGDVPTNGPGTGVARLAALKALVNTQVSFEDIDYAHTGVSETVEVVSVDTVSPPVIHQRHDGKNMPGLTAVVTLRKVGR
ncbi:MAG: hypothetical protein AAGA99_00710 [Actinomycetota bacterium]